MARTWIRQDVQVASTTTTDVGYIDNTAPTLANWETNAGTLTDDLNNLRSATHYLLKLQSGNWYDVISTPSTFEGGAPRAVDGLNQDLHDLEHKRVLTTACNLSDVTVPTAVAATGTLTLTGNVSNNDQVTTGTKTYTFQTVLTNVDGNVLIGGSASDSIDNLIAAITLGAGAGTLYAAATTANGFLTAAAGAGDTMDATALVAGTAGNTIATTDPVDSGNVMSWGATTLTGGAGDIVILALGELPSNTTAAVGAVTTLGTVAAYNATFGTATLAEVSGATAISPKNLCVIVDADTRDPILSSGRTVYALFQTETATDGHTMTGTTPNRAQLTFVRINAAGDDLELVPGADIGGKDINYCSVTRKYLSALTEQDFLKGAEIDFPSSATVTRQVAYDNQGTTPVELTTNAILDLNSAGIYWRIRDLANANLFTLTEGSTGGTTKLEVGSDVDVFEVNAILNDFDKGVKVATGGAEIDIGTTVIANTATIESVGATTDLRLLGSRELFLDDVNQVGSTWAQTNGIKLSDTTTEWDNFETAFGEVSLLKAITDAYTKQKRSKVQAVLTANVNAGNDVNGPSYANNTDVDLLPYNLVPTGFVADVEVFLNGELLRNALGATEDVYPGTTPSQGDLMFTFKLKGTGAKPDQLTVIVNGQ